MAGTFHSVRTNSQLPAANTGTPGDVWWVNETGLLWFIEGTGNPIQLLTAVPIAVAGPKGDTGERGEQGQSFPMSFPTETQIGGVTSTVKFGGADADGNTGYLVTGIENGIGESFERR